MKHDWFEYCNCVEKLKPLIFIGIIYFTSLYKMLENARMEINEPNFKFSNTKKLVEHLYDLYLSSWSFSLPLSSSKCKTIRMLCALIVERCLYFLLLLKNEKAFAQTKYYAALMRTLTVCAQIRLRRTQLMSHFFMLFTLFVSHSIFFNCTA